MKRTTESTRQVTLVCVLLLDSLASARADSQTHVSIVNGRWHINGMVTYPGTKAEGLLMNVRMVNATFEDRKDSSFDPEENTDRFLAKIPDYAAHGVRAFTICLQGGMPGYEGAVNSAFNPDGSLRESYLMRVRRVIGACNRQGIVVILGCYYQRQSAILKDEEAVRTGVTNVVKWLRDNGFTNVVLEAANEYPHEGFVHEVLRSPDGEARLLRLAKRVWPQLLVSASGYGDGKLHPPVAEASDFLLIHFNGTPVERIPERIAALRKLGKPIVCNEDDKTGPTAARAAEVCVSNGASWGLMLSKLNQYMPFTFRGAEDDPIAYAKLKELTGPAESAVHQRGRRPDDDYFPPPESQGGWRRLDTPAEIRQSGGMAPEKLADLRQWLLASDNRDFAAVVIRRGHIVLEVERGNSARTDARRVASVSKAVCATMLAIASEQSQHGLTPKRMTFDDPAFDFIPWAQPLSDPRKAQIKIKQLLNHTSGICPEATGAPNQGSWAYILGHTGDLRTAKLAFDPGTACGYSTHAVEHASLVCETVTGKPYDEFAIEALFKPIGVEHWWFERRQPGGEKYGRHPGQHIGMPARDLARIAYCMLHGGRWQERQVIPAWFVRETAAPTHDVKTPEMRWKLNPQIFSHGWELPSRLTGEGGRSGEGLPADARSKPGSGGQLIAFVPSLDLVVTRQTGSSGEWAFEEFLRRACDAVLPPVRTCSAAAAAVEGGLKLTSRALIAVPQKDHAVFLTWRFLQEDGEEAAFDVCRSMAPEAESAKIGTARETTTFRDSPGKGNFSYYVVPTAGAYQGRRSNVARVTTQAKGRDWVEILPAMRGRKLQFSERHFADVDGDGELEFVTYYPQVPSYRGGQSSESYKLQVYRLLDDVKPKWIFDTGMGRQSDPASGDFRADWDYEWTFKPVAFDIDGNGKAEIITLAKIEGKYEYVVLKDEGDRCRIAGTLDSPIPVGDKNNNSRHFPFFARLGGKNYSFCLQGGTYKSWEMWTYDWNGKGFDLRWHVKTGVGFQGNRSSSHTVLAVDLDGDGLDEISNGATVLNHDGSVRWTANAEFGPDNHIDGQVIDDIDPDNPGLEVMLHTEQGDKYALYDASSGKLRWLKQAPGKHLQLNIAANVTGGKGLDILGTFGGHKPQGGFACTYVGKDFEFPFSQWPLNGDRWWAMDWDGDRGRNICLNFTQVYGAGGKLLDALDFRDVPQGDVIPWDEHKLNHLWFNVDIVGDYREDIPVQMPDGSVRVYLNTTTPPHRRPCKWQDPQYNLLQSPGDYRYFIRARNY